MDDIIFKTKNVSLIVLSGTYSKDTSSIISCLVEKRVFCIIKKEQELEVKKIFSVNGIKAMEYIPTINYQFEEFKFPEYDYGFFTLTSGTKGALKLVAHSSQNFNFCLKKLSILLSIHSNNEIHSYWPLNSVGFIIMLLIAKLNNAKFLHLSNPIFSFNSYARSSDLIITVMSPYLMKIILKKNNELKLDCFKSIGFTSMPLSKLLIEECFKRGVPVVHNIYGATEIPFCPISSSYSKDLVNDNLGSIGNRLMAQVKVDHSGSLFLKSPGITPIRLTLNGKEQFKNKWYPTNDQVILKNGSYWYNGRSDDRMIIKGRKIFPSKYEMAIIDKFGLSDIVLTKVYLDGRDYLVLITKNDISSTNGNRIMQEFKIDYILHEDSCLLFHTGKINRDKASELALLKIQSLKTL